MKQRFCFSCGFMGAYKTVNIYQTVYLNRSILIYVRCIFLKVDLIGQLRFKSTSSTFPTQQNQLLNSANLTSNIYFTRVSPLTLHCTVQSLTSPLCVFLLRAAQFTYHSPHCSSYHVTPMNYLLPLAAFVIARSAEQSFPPFLLLTLYTSTSGFWGHLAPHTEPLHKPFLTLMQLYLLP